MSVTYERNRPTSHPFHAAIVAGTVPLFLGALLADLAYRRTEEIQWINFADWLIAGGLVFAAVGLVGALAGLLRAGRGGAAVLVLVLLFALGFVDALVHARDAGATMPTGVVLSALVALLSIVATWLAFAAHGTGMRR